MRVTIGAVGGALVLLTGCITGGGSSDDSRDQVSDAPREEASQEEGSVRVQFQRRMETQTAQVFTQALDEPSMVRIVIRNPETSFRVIEDYPVPDTVDATISVPVGNGYEIAGISYKEGAAQFGNHLVLKTEVKDDISVASDSVTNVALVLEEPTVSFTYPDSVNEGALTSVSFSEEPGFFRPTFWVYYDFDHLAFPSFDGAEREVGTDEVQFNAPSVDTKDTLHAMLALLLQEQYRKGSEGINSFRYYVPDQPTSQGQLEIEVLPEEGEIGVDIEY
ncbi:hypothetical protein [Salicola sp. Rm-C-2C1-2]|uniref:hypothetical protein n=1 Tax=Salicola sp. Rm-C-2C1-2 TaxID=3141321 RepID=UPI0032E4F47D